MLLPSADRRVDLQLGGLEVRSSLGRARMALDTFEHHRRARHFPLFLGNYIFQADLRKNGF